MADALRLALALFTVVPVRARRYDRRTAGRALALGPLIGAVLAVAAAAVLLVARVLYQERFGLPLAAALTIGTLAVLTGGRHLAGLVHTVDRLGSETAAIADLTSRPGAAGPLGVAALVLVVLVQVGALGVCVIAHRGTESLLLAVLTGRLAAVWAGTTGTTETDGDEPALRWGGSVRRGVAVGLTVVVAVEAALYGRLDGDAGSYTASLRALGALAAGLVVADLLRRYAVRRLGGITGDLLGALLEVAALVVLLGMGTGS